MDAIIICVPTPLDEYREPDLSFITNTAKAIAPHLRAGQLVVLESTTYPGTTEEVLVPILEEGNGCGLKAARDATANGEDEFFVAFSPEREDPGNDSIARRDIPKVVGGLNSQASELAATLYGTIFNRVVPVSSPAVAEMTKLLENIYRCVNIALVNELKLLSLRMGLDIWEVIEAASTKPFGFQPFYPGPGLGGHCIPVDPYYLSWKAKAWDFQTRFIELAGEINSAMPYHVVSSVSRALSQQRKALNGAKVLVLGVAYKKDIDDLRESPALTIIELLQKDGAQVSYNDPYFPFDRQRAQIRSSDEMRARGRRLQVRLCADRHRPFGLRLRLDRAARILGGGYPQRDERHSRRQHCALLDDRSEEKLGSRRLQPLSCAPFGKRVKPGVARSH